MAKRDGRKATEQTTESGGILEACRAKLREVDPADEHGRTFAETIADRLVVQAARGDIGAVKELLARSAYLREAVHARLGGRGNA